MHRTIRSLIGLGIIATTGVGLVGTGIGGAAGSTRAGSAVQATPKLKVTISKTSLTLNGPKKFAPGRVALSLKAVGGDRTVAIARFAGSYTFSDLRADLKAFGQGQGPTGESKAGLKALNHAVNHTTLYGGLDVDKATASGTVVLPKAGTYVLWNDSGNLPVEPRTLTVSGPVAKRAAVHSTATVTTTNAKRFSGATVLPAHGTLTFKDKATNSPHMLIIQHVKAGTTRKQVVDYFNAGVDTPPPWGLPGGANAAIVSPGQSMTVNTDMPAGTYFETCFFPDLQTGMPHAFMGMVRIVTAK
jgi:hypothetical protein